MLKVASWVLLQHCVCFTTNKRNRGISLLRTRYNSRKIPLYITLTWNVYKGLKQIEETTELLFSSNENAVMLGNILFPNEMLNSTEAIGCWYLYILVTCAVFSLPVPLLWQWDARVFINPSSRGGELGTRRAQSKLSGGWQLSFLSLAKCRSRGALYRGHWVVSEGGVVQGLWQ